MFMIDNLCEPKCTCFVESLKQALLDGASAEFLSSSAPYVIGEIKATLDTSRALSGVLHPSIDS